MPFLAFIGVAIIALFVGGSLISGITTSLKDRTTSSLSSRVINSTGQTAVVVLSTAHVAGASIQNLSALNDINSLVNDLPNVSRFQEFFKEAHGAMFLVEPFLYTLFIPTDSAFSQLPYTTQTELNGMTQEELERFVTYHVVPQKMVSVGEQKVGTVTALSRDALNFELRDSGGAVGNAHVVSVHNAENGIVYVIDGVLLPPIKHSTF